MADERDTTAPPFETMAASSFITASAIDRSIEEHAPLLALRQLGKRLLRLAHGFAGFRPLRKLSFSVQLSASEDYEGGDLELWAANRP